MITETEIIDFSIPILGEPKVPSPVSLSTQKGDYVSNYVDDDQYLIYDILTDGNKAIHSFDKTYTHSFNQTSNLMNITRIPILLLPY